MTVAQQHGRALHAKLVASLQTDRDGGGPLNAGQLAALVASWRQASPRLDRNSCQRTQRPCAQSPSACVGRCSWTYWEDHGRITAVLMKNAAALTGGDPHLYEQVGRLHDLDYLLHPHDTKHGAGTGARHPAPLVEALAQLDFSTFGQIAILEHAPYLGLDRCKVAACAALSLSL